MRNNTVVICGTFLLISCIGSVVYLTESGRPVESVIGLMLPIIAAVCATVYNTGKIDQVKDSVDTVKEQTNGGLTVRIEEAIKRAMLAREVGNPAGTADVPAPTIGVDNGGDATVRSA